MNDYKLFIPDLLLSEIKTNLQIEDNPRVHDYVLHWFLHGFVSI